MMRSTKVLASRTGGLRPVLIVLLALAAAACGRLGTRVDNKIETVGSELTGVAVVVERVELRPARGLREITGFTVANPAGDAAPYALQMDLLRLNLGVVSSLVGERLVLDELVIDSPAVTFIRRR